MESLTNGLYLLENINFLFLDPITKISPGNIKETTTITLALKLIAQRPEMFNFIHIMLLVFLQIATN